MCVCVRARMSVCVYFVFQKSLYNDNNHLYWMEKNILPNDNTLPNESLFKTRGNEKKELRCSRLRRSQRQSVILSLAKTHRHTHSPRTYSRSLRT